MKPEWWGLTRLNAKVKMHVVDSLFEGSKYATEVWISDKAAKAFKKFKKRDPSMASRFLQSLEHYAEAGFANFEGKKGTPVRHEGDAVYRVAYSASLFRLIGFYEEADKTVFIAMDAFLKGGQELSSSERNRLKNVASIRDKQEWRRRPRDEPNGA